MKLNKKTLVIISSIFIGIIITTLVIINLSMEENVQTFEGSEDLFSIYIKVDGEYIETDLMKFPEDLTFDSEESYCINGSLLNWNSNTKQMSIDVTGSEHCYVYFKSETFGEYLISNHNEAEHGLIQHTSAISTSAEDNNYRYSGGDNLVQNNYVCFGSDEATCPSANLYRIMGIYEGNVKLTTANLLPDRAFDSGDDNRWEGADVNNASDDANIDIYLNGEYLNSIPSKYQEMIKDHNYNIGGVPWDTTYKPKDFYEDEIITKTKQTYKIGLMNISDYLYSSSKGNWDYNNYNGSGANEYYNTQNKETNNWLFHGDYYWAINPSSSYSYIVWIVSDVGYAFGSGNASLGCGAAPVLYLETNVKVLSGNGSQSEPFRVGL